MYNGQFVTIVRWNERLQITLKYYLLCLINIVFKNHPSVNELSPKIVKTICFFKMFPWVVFKLIGAGEEICIYFGTIKLY